MFNIGERVIDTQHPEWGEGVIETKWLCGYHVVKFADSHSWYCSVDTLRHIHVNKVGTIVLLQQGGKVVAKQPVTGATAEGKCLDADEKNKYFMSAVMALGKLLGGKQL